MSLTNKLAYNNLKTNKLVITILKTIMKLRFILLALATYGTLTVGAQNYTTGIPTNPTNYGYLKDYLPLKEYIDYEKYPNFKLGLAIGGNDYLNNSTVMLTALASEIGYDKATKAALLLKETGKTIKEIIIEAENRYSILYDSRLA